MKPLVVALVLAGVAVIVGARCMTVRKDLVSERQAISVDWAQVDAALAHRSGIVPELAETLQAEAPPDARPALVRAITAAGAARNALAAARSRPQEIRANARLDDALARLMLVVENYPKLARSKKYGDLLETLKNAEYQIALARRKYNEAVEHYNAGIDLFPHNIVASLSGLGKIDAYFQTPAI
jgi:LemA protein